MQAFSCLATLPASALVIACPATNPWSLSPTRGDTPVKSTHACFPPSHQKTRMSAGRRTLRFWSHVRDYNYIRDNKRLKIKIAEKNK
ncbi:hypothetical protein Hanom_Chr09g00860531 [Helianthus anomalus]